MTDDNQIELPQRFSVLGVMVSALTPQRLLEIVRGWINERSRHSIHVFNTASVLECVDSPELMKTVNESSLVIPDGMPLVFLGRHAGLKIERCYGPDVMLDIMRDGLEPGYRHFLYGCTDDVLEMLDERLRKKLPGIKIVGKIAPPFRALTEQEKRVHIETINASGADVVWVGLGTPKQDIWMGEFRGLLEPSVLVAVGAAFNFHAGNVRQAPRWMMRSGLEWLFRLLVEPRRLWRRYIIGNPRFIWLIIKQKVAGKKTA